MARHTRFAELEGGMSILTAEATRLASELTPTPPYGQRGFPLVLIGVPKVTEVCYGVITVGYRFEWLIPPDDPEQNHETRSGVVRRAVEFTVLDALPFGVQQWQIVEVKVYNHAGDHVSASLMDTTCGSWREVSIDALPSRNINPEAALIGIRTVKIEGAVALVEQTLDREAFRWLDICVVGPCAKGDSVEPVATSELKVIARKEFADMRGYVRAQTAMAKIRLAYDELWRSRRKFEAALRT